MSTERLWKGAAAGFIGGLAGAWTMRRFQKTIQGDRPQPRDLDVVITAETATKFRLPKQAVHYAAGTIAGALYGAAAELLPAATLGGGLLFGTALWAVGDELAAPALGLAQTTKQMPASAHAWALASHLIYSTTA